MTGKLPPTLNLSKPAAEAEPNALATCPTCGKTLVDQPNFCAACGGDLRGLGGHSDTFSGALTNRLIDGRYRLMEKLGEGGMGAVFKVEHVRMEKIAALKVMRSDMAIDAELKSRFLQEARTVAKLSHANTVQVFDAGELDDGSLFMAMEFVPGKDLAWHLKANGPMTEASAVSLAMQVLSSLQEAHEHGIVHRDIKPANVMLVKRPRGEDQVKLLDFGIAKLLESDARKSTTADFVGTPAYMSPEQINGVGIDARSDLYSLGAMLFELVTGTPPFDSETPMLIIAKHMNDPVPRFASVAPTVQLSPAFEQVVRRALEKNSADRFQDADEMRKALRELRRAMGVTTAELTPPPLELPSNMLSREDFDRFERKLRRQRSVAPIAAALALCAFGLGGWKYATTRPVDAPSTHEVEPNDQLTQATSIVLGADISGAMNAAALGQNDRDLFKATVAPGSYRLTLRGVADLNLTLEVLQMEQTEEGMKLRRKVFLDDIGEGGDERLDGLQLAAGEVYLRVEEKPFCTQPNRPSREKSLASYALRLEATAGAGTETEPNDTSGTAELLTTAEPLTAFTGVKLDDPERLVGLRTDAPFTSFDWFRVEAGDDEQVAVMIVPPERGALLIIDGAALETWKLKRAQSTPKRPAPPAPQPMVVRVVTVLELKPIEGQSGRRLRVLPGDEALPGSSYQLAVATSGPGGLQALLRLAAGLGVANRTASQRQVLEWGLKVFERSSPDARALKDALDQLAQ